MGTENNILDILPLLAAIFLVELIEMNPYVELLLMILVGIYTIVKIGYAITKWIYLIKNKGKES
ncbi:MAG: hypothetical protein FVQ77_10405 [Cytophagales bacterium]|nr:hypothetical protein [Cytophagales bacterium]